MRDGGLAKPEAHARAEAGLAPSGRRAEDAQGQASRGRQRIRTLDVWRKIMGSRVDVLMHDQTRVSGTLVACDAKQNGLFVQGLCTADGTISLAQLRSSDAMLIDVAGNWELTLAAGSHASALDERDSARAELPPAQREDAPAEAAAPTPAAAAAGKYWPQRYSLWSRFDDGIRMDEEGWFSVTPERLARHIAHRCQCDLVLDPFAGVGGNAIQFAMMCERVVAIDIDLHRLQLTRDNARVYGVADRIEFIHGDFTALAPRLRADVVFLSPPWGGPSYQDAESFDARQMGGLDGFELLRLALGITPHVGYYLPRTADDLQLSQMGGMQGKRWRASVEVESCVLNGRPKAIMAYFGELNTRARAAGGGDDNDDVDDVTTS